MRQAVENKPFLTPSATVRKPYEDRKTRAISEDESNRKGLRAGFEQLETRNNQRISGLTGELKEIDRALTELTKSGPKATVTDMGVIERFRSEAAKKVAPSEENYQPSKQYYQQD